MSIYNTLQGVTQITSERALELDITYVCNMGCVQCNRGIGVIPSKEFVTTSQIKKLLDQCLKLSRPFEQLRILGGEPTLHPDLSEILSIINVYRKEVKNCIVTLWSHGYGRLVQERLKQLPKWVNVKISPKKPIIGGENFEAFLAAPIDFENQHDKSYSEGCWQIRAGKCGVSFTPFGIYACPVAGAIDRIIRLNIGIKDTTEISTESFKNQCKQLCRYCGHYLTYHDIHVSKDTISKTWKNLISKKSEDESLLTRF